MNKRKRISAERQELLAELDKLRDAEPRSSYDEEWIDKRIAEILRQLDPDEDDDFDEFDEFDESDESDERILNAEDEDEENEETEATGKRPASKSRDEARSGRFKDFDDLFARNDSEPYAQFPALLLGIVPLEPRGRGRPKKGELGTGKTDLIDHLIWYSVCRLAQYLWKQAEEGKCLPVTETPPKGYNKSNKLHVAVASAMRRLEVSGGTIQAIGKIRRECAEFVERFREDSKSLVRLPMRSLQRLRVDPGMSELDFRILCAVSCRIGDKPYAITNMDDLGRLAVGAERIAAVRRLGVRPLTRFQVSHSLGRLQEGGFIHRALNGRVTFVCRASRMPLAKLKMAAKSHSSKRREKRKAAKIQPGRQPPIKSSKKYS